MKRFRTYRTLAPAAAIYSAIQQLRNIMYDHNILKSETFPIPVICIGNITVGGTGKTPMIQHLIELLKDKYRIAVLSRGYGRATKGYLLATGSTAQPEIGDEPYQMHVRYPDVTIAVSEKRAIGIKNLIRDVNPQVILLDDAFQHRAVKASLNILLTDYSRNMLDDAVMPAGRLREKLSGIGRTDLIVMTKCPEGISQKETEAERARFSSYGKPMFFTTLRYGELKGLKEGSTTPPRSKALMMTGIAKPEPMKQYLTASGYQLSELAFADHHTFSLYDLRKMEGMLDTIGSDAIMITTEKDAARLSAMDLPEKLSEKTFILPVDCSFVTGGTEFDNIITEHIRNFKK